MNAAKSDQGNGIGRTYLTTSGNAEATSTPVCALYACTLCRHALLLDGHNVECSSTLPSPTTTLSSSSSHHLLSTSSSSVGGFLMSSRASSLVDKEANERRRRLRDEQMTRLQKYEEERERQIISSRGELEVGDTYEQHETTWRQKLHPSIRGSLLTAAGKYAPLAPSPLSLWLNERYAILKKHPRRNVVRCGNNGADTKSDVKHRGLTPARIVARLSPLFVYQYEWLAREVSAVYMQELWCMFHDGPVPPPQPSTQLTVQKDEFLRSVTIVGSGSGSSTVSSTMSHASTNPIHTSTSLKPPSPAEMGVVQREPREETTSQCSFPVPDDSTSPSLLLLCGSKNPQSSLGNREEENISTKNVHMTGRSENVAVSNSHYVIPPTPSSSPSHFSRILTVHKIKSVPYDMTTNASTVQKSRISTPTTSSLTVMPSPKLPHTPLPSREIFLLEFARRLMRFVVRKTDTNAPLCVRCWKEILEMKKKDTARVIEDIVALSAVSTNPDATSVILCFRPRSNNNNNNNNNNSDEHLEKQTGSNAAVTYQDIITQESLNRLQIELCEAEMQKKLMHKACHTLRCELAKLSKQVALRKVELNDAMAKNNAQHVLSFFTVEDASCGEALRRQQTLCSFDWMSNTHALSLTFPIETSGIVGTILGLRLGKCPALLPSSSSSQRRRNSLRSDQSRVFPTLEPSSSAAAATTGFAREIKNSTESTRLACTLHMQREYVRNLLGSRNDVISNAEINQACGYLLLLLKLIVDHHSIPLQEIVLHPNGERSTVETVSSHGSQTRVTRHSFDFFICDKLFTWKAFRSACVTVASCVWEIAAWLKEHLTNMHEIIISRRQQHSNVEEELLFGEMETEREPPYVISHDHRVDGFSVRHGDVSDELWTIGMKKLLEIVRWCVTASRSVDNMRRVLEKT